MESCMRFKTMSVRLMTIDSNGKRVKESVTQLTAKGWCLYSKRIQIVWFNRTVVFYDSVSNKYWGIVL